MATRIATTRSTVAPNTTASPRVLPATPRSFTQRSVRVRTIAMSRTLGAMTSQRPGAKVVAGPRVEPSRPATEARRSPSTLRAPTDTASFARSAAQRSSACSGSSWVNSAIAIRMNMRAHLVLLSLSALPACYALNRVGEECEPSPCPGAEVEWCEESADCDEVPWCGTTVFCESAPTPPVCGPAECPEGETLSEIRCSPDEAGCTALTGCHVGVYCRAEAPMSRCSTLAKVRLRRRGRQAGARASTPPRSLRRSASRLGCTVAALTTAS